jgi:hypothetical protein
MYSVFTSLLPLLPLATYNLPLITPNPAECTAADIAAPVVQLLPAMKYW